MCVVCVSRSMSMINQKHAHTAALIAPPYHCIAIIRREDSVAGRDGVEHVVARALAARRRGLALVLLGKRVIAAGGAIPASDASLVVVGIAEAGSSAITSLRAGARFGVCVTDRQLRQIGQIDR